MAFRRGREMHQYFSTWPWAIWVSLGPVVSVELGGRDPRWETGMPLVGSIHEQRDASLLAEMTMGMPQVQGLATAISSRASCMRSGATISARGSILEGKDSWLQFCEELKVHPIRLHEQATQDLIEFDTMLYVMFLAWKVPRMEAGKGRGQEINSADLYLSRVNGWVHDKCKRQVQINRVWYNAQRDAYKVQKIAQKGRPPRHRKLAFIPAHFELIHRIPGLNWNEPWHRTWLTAAKVAFNLGLRVGEYTQRRAEDFNPNTAFNMADVSWYRANGQPFNPAELVMPGGWLRDNDFCLINAIPTKTDRLLQKFADMQFPLKNYAGNRITNACLGLAILELQRKVFNPEERAKRPLFESPKTGKAMTYNEFAGFFKKVLAAALGSDLATKFGTHSFRIGGATTLKAQGVHDDEIMAWGRWNSDCYRRYIRVMLSSLIGLGVHLNPVSSSDIPVEQLNQQGLLQRTFLTSSRASCTPAAAAQLPLMSKGEAQRGAQLSGALAASILTSGTDFDFGSSNEVEGRFEHSDDEESLPDVEFGNLSFLPLPPTRCP